MEAFKPHIDMGLAHSLQPLDFDRIVRFIAFNPHHWRLLLSEQLDALGRIEAGRIENDWYQDQPTQDIEVVTQEAILFIHDGTCHAKMDIGQKGLHKSIIYWLTKFKKNIIDYLTNVR